MKFRVIGLAMIALVSACSGVTREQLVQKERTDCALSPIKFTVDVRPARDGDCEWALFQGDSPNAYGYEEFYRYAEDDRGFIKALYLKASRNSHLNWYDAQTVANRQWSAMKRADAWHDAASIETADHKFDIASFRLPKDRACTAFVSYWQPSVHGFDRMLSGYFCGGTESHGRADQLAVLSSIKIEE